MFLLYWYANWTTDFDFSSNNQYIASSSMDKTVRVWEISKGNCIRVIYGISSQLCIRFHPVRTQSIYSFLQSKLLRYVQIHICLFYFYFYPWPKLISNLLNPTDNFYFLFFIFDGLCSKLESLVKGLHCKGCHLYPLIWLR